MNGKNNEDMLLLGTTEEFIVDARESTARSRWKGPD